MSKIGIGIEHSPVFDSKKEVKGYYERKWGDVYYKIEGLKSMPIFFMTIVSSTNQWMFIASNGGLTTGRINPENAIFPYQTDDKIIADAENTGSKTLFRVEKKSKLYLWEPLSEKYHGLYNTSQNLYKNKIGNKLVFEEINHDLELAFRYSWTFSPEYGFVKKSQVENLGTDEPILEVLDGIQNILPWGIGSQIQTTRSTLVNAYKKNELLEKSGIGVYSLSSMIVDRAEPSEALKATTVWSAGLDRPKYLLSSEQVDAFRNGDEIQTERFVKAKRGSYFINSKFKLNSSELVKWMLIAETGQGNAQVKNLEDKILNDANFINEIEEGIEAGQEALKRIVALADGLQLGEDELCTSRHFSNVLFNVMRGGVFEFGYELPLDDFREYIQKANIEIYQKHKSFIDGLEDGLRYFDLIERTIEIGDLDLKRICTEYLPISFSRRHGDPSRPWNYFNIHYRGRDGKINLDFEGNWRDIFQNWEALAFSYPNYIKGMIYKFLNASTADGYNPYRITKDGIDWEVIEEDNPWSYIGYWGDHQIIYLQKLLEFSKEHFPGLMKELLHSKEFVFANVPYRIKDFNNIYENPFDTIEFDEELDKTLRAKMSEIGSDGALLRKFDGRLSNATLAEKLLVTMLTKLYNFVPNGGIWLNTQRPEWNDANNALVGNGLSMVTLHYLRRYLVYCREMLCESGDSYELNSNLYDLLHEVGLVFAEVVDSGDLNFSPERRKDFVVNLGLAGEKFRHKAYMGFDDLSKSIGTDELKKSIDDFLALVENSLTHSKREDGLYHSYNILKVKEDGIEIDYLYQMLEGQVAALSSGLLDPDESHALLDQLKESAMFRDDQYSYLLYPNRSLPSFVDLNTIPKDFDKNSKLAGALKAIDNRDIFEWDDKGNIYFGGELHNAKDLQSALDNLKSGDLKELVEEEESSILDLFESVFDHRSFTGRSGSMYAYEGLGSIYWHMVSKLLLAVQENLIRAQHEERGIKSIGKLIDHYYEIRAGIGFNKSPEVYGAFPTDAYSHTPDEAGAKQPGLTGQVKEDIINRWAELGIDIEEGRIILNPTFFRKEELLKEKKTFKFYDSWGRADEIALNEGEIAFTYCGVLFIYKSASQKNLKLIMANQEEKEFNDCIIPADLSSSIFSRLDEVKQVRLEFPFNA